MYSQASDPPVLALKGVSREYPGSGLVLDNVNLEIHRGERVAIVGPSGSGKSTMLQLLGLLEAPSSGRVELLGQRVESLPPRRIAHTRATAIGFVFQQSWLVDALTVRQNVELALIYQHVRREERADRANAALTSVGLEHRSSHRPQALSGGERQRVALARAIVGKPQVVLADEPTGSLDSMTGQVVLDLLLRRDEPDATVVVITHDETVARRFPRTIQVLDGHVHEGVSP